MRRLATLLALTGTLISCGDTSNNATATNSSPTMTLSLTGAPGAAIWQGQCAACHGAAGEGNRGLGAPALTQLSAEYIARQLNHFVSGIRGAVQRWAFLAAAGSAATNRLGDFPYSGDYATGLYFYGSYYRVPQHGTRGPLIFR